MAPTSTPPAAGPGTGDGCRNFCRGCAGAIASLIVLPVLAYPPPWEYRLAERNLAAVWSNYRALGYRCLIYTNTVSVQMIDSLTAAMGDSPHVTAVLLTCGDAMARQRLAQREIGGGLEAHIGRGKAAARELDKLAPAWVHRVPTDDRTVADIAAEVIGLAGRIAG